MNVVWRIRLNNFFMNDLIARRSIAKSPAIQKLIPGF
jgi:hypothetical protein